MLDIFIAEDDLDDLEMFKSALSEVLPNFNITHARDGNQCIKVLMNYPPPDVIFLDVRMPMKSGLQCLGTIKCEPDLSAIPVIMLSTSNRMEEVDACYRAGATLYLVKPDDEKSLAVALKGAFRMLGRPKRERQQIQNFVVGDSK